jgi:ferrous iron transport protein B
MHSGGRGQITVGLVGQPNCGKSTIFNAVAGYRSISANFPGATVNYTISTTRVDGILIQLVDLPGTYSLTGSSPIEVATRDYLLREKVDVFIHILDASMLARGLEFTIELLEYGTPVVVCLNMMDDAAAKGIEIDAIKLSRILKVPVAPTTATQGTGIKQLMRAAVDAARSKIPPNILRGHKDVEQVISQLSDRIVSTNPVVAGLPKRLVALKLLQEDEHFANLVDSPDLKTAANLRRTLEELHGCDAFTVVHAQRHALSMSLAEEVSTVGSPQRDFREVLDRILMHPFWGYVVMIVALYLFFVLIFTIGSQLETVLTGMFSNWTNALKIYWSDSPLTFALINGLFQGIAGGITLVFPYLIPFLIGLAFLEDLGYLPRVAFLMDGLMHRIGLHGTSLLPAMLGYGCSVPAVMATRILHSPRDRIIAAVISTLVPCSARTIVILGLVGFYLGPVWAFAMYGFNLLIVILSGRVLSHLLPQLTPGMILEIPRYQIPSLASMMKKTWFRVRDFVMIAWPLLMIGSVALALGEFLQFNSMIDSFLRPLTSGVLGLPVVVGTTLILGILRKELSLLMLTQALGTIDVASILTDQQIITFTVFVMFYVPCVATLGVLLRELGARMTLFTALYTMVLATAAGWFARIVL